MLWRNCWNIFDKALIRYNTIVQADKTSYWLIILIWLLNYCTYYYPNGTQEEMHYCLFSFVWSVWCWNYSYDSVVVMKKENILSSFLQKEEQSVHSLCLKNLGFPPAKIVTLDMVHTTTFLLVNVYLPIPIVIRVVSVRVESFEGMSLRSGSSSLPQC